MIVEMRTRTSVTLPDDLLRQIDRQRFNRSRFLESAARRFLADLEKSRRGARDEAILNADSKRLNKEAMDVLEYQDFGGL